MERYHADYFAVSIPTQKFETKTNIVWRCEDCNILVPLSYRLGVEGSNIDEYYSGDCTRCWESMSYEPNYEPYTKEIFPLFSGSKLIVIGDRSVFKAWHQRKTFKQDMISKEEFETILVHGSEVDIPEKLHSKKELGQYIEQFF